MHDESHEERILLEGPQAAQASCPGCREFLASWQAASGSARRAALNPPAWLDAQALGQAARPRWSRIGLGLAVAMAVAALVILPGRQEKPNLHWTNGIEKDMARMDQELQDLTLNITLNADSAEIDADIKSLESDAKEIQRQLGG